MAVDPLTEPQGGTEASTPAPPPRTQANSTCSNCGSTQQNPPVQAGHHSRSFVYAIGRIECRFPSISVEKEFAQALGRAGTAGKTDREAFYKVLSDPENLYLARQLCWVMRISDVDTYIVLPKYPTDIHLLIHTLRASSDIGVLDAVIGIKGPAAPPDLCNGLNLPVVVFEHVYSFDRESLLRSIPIPSNAGPEFSATVAEVWDRIVASTDNGGATDPHRALNYLALRDPAIYARTADCFARDLSLTAIETRPWRLSTSRKIVEVLFVFTNRKNEFVEKYSVRVDVNDMFPFLASKMTHYYDH